MVDKILTIIQDFAPPPPSTSNIIFHSLSAYHKPPTPGIKHKGISGGGGSPFPPPPKKKNVNMFAPPNPEDSMEMKKKITPPPILFLSMTRYQTQPFTDPNIHNGRGYGLWMEVGVGGMFKYY